MTDQQQLDARRALEALRSGVPNSYAVQALGCDQPAVIERYTRQLSAAIEAAPRGEQAHGVMVEGGFGAGKSHLLEYLKFLALEQGFVCSVVVLGKETPLYDAGKVFAAASEAAEARDVSGNAIQEIAARLRTDRDEYGEFARWAYRAETGISPLLAATLMLHERGDEDKGEEIRNFWAGAKLPIAEIRQGMKQIGQAHAFPIRAVPAKELPLQRFRFATQLFRAAGYRGWVLLFDEVELIGKYSRLQRGRSYAELARWLGAVEAERYAGLLAVATITDDFASAVLMGKQDLDHIGPFLESKGTEAYQEMAGRAVTGMRLINRDALLLHAPSDDTLQRTHDVLREMYATAYGWEPAARVVTRESVGRRMRSYVRRWINEWDLERLYPGEILETVETEIRIDYTENAELERMAEDGPAYLESETWNRD